MKNETTEQSSLVSKVLLYALIVSVLLCAVLSIMGLLGGVWGAWRINLSSVVVASASLCGLACAASLGSKRAFLLPVVGIVSVVAASILTVTLIWVPDLFGESFAKMQGMSIILAIVFTHSSLLALPRLAPKFRWVQYLGILLTLLLGALYSIILVGFDLPLFAGLFFIQGVALILAITASILVPIFHLLSRNEVGNVDDRTQGNAENFRRPTSALPVENDPASQLMVIETDIRRLENRLEELRKTRLALEKKISIGRA